MNWFWMNDTVKGSSSNSQSHSNSNNTSNLSTNTTTMTNITNLNQSSSGTNSHNQTTWQEGIKPAQRGSVSSILSSSQTNSKNGSSGKEDSWTPRMEGYLFKWTNYVKGLDSVVQNGLLALSVFSFHKSFYNTTIFALLLNFCENPGEKYLGFPIFLNSQTRYKICFFIQ